jgi:hypothetical protein
MLYRFTKAKGAKNHRRLSLLKAKNRLEWHDVPNPAEQELRDFYRIARNHQGQFVRSFTLAPEKLLGAEELTAIRTAPVGNTAAVVDALPWVASGLPREKEVWTPSLNRYQKLFGSVIETSGVKELQRLDIDEPFLASNVFSKQWIDARTKRLVRDISDSSKKSLTQTIERGFFEGMHPRSVANVIERNIGLTTREGKAVDNFFANQLALGKTRTEADLAAAKYSNRLLKARARRIARTEMVTAQARGQSDAWKVAREAGQLDPKVMKEWIAVMASLRTCEICMELDGQRKPLDEPFESSFVGSIDSPTAHPHCRCVMRLRSPRFD